MTERLKQIWSGFEGRTTRRLSGRGIDNIVTPPARRFSEDVAPPTPEGVECPAGRATAALRDQILLSAKQAARKPGGKSRSAGAFNGQEPDPHAIELGATEARQFGAPAEAAELIKALQATEMRVVRPPADYGVFLETDAGRRLAAQNKRRKFFGLF